MSPFSPASPRKAPSLSREAALIQIPYYFIIWFMPFMFFKLSRISIQPLPMKLVGALISVLVYGWILLLRLRVSGRSLKNAILSWIKSLKSDAASLFFVAMLCLFVVSRLINLQYEGSLFFNPQQRWEGLVYFLCLFVFFRMGMNAPQLGDHFWISFCCSASLSAYLRVAEAYNFPLILSPSRYLIGENFRAFPVFDGYPYAGHGNPNFYAAYMALVIPISIYLLLQRGKAWAVFPLALQVFSLILNTSRSGVVGLVIAFPIYWLLVLIYEKNRTLFQNILLALFPIAALVALFFLYRLFPGAKAKMLAMAQEIKKIPSLLRRELPIEEFLTIASGRGMGYYSGYRAVRMSPIFGMGFGSHEAATMSRVIPQMDESVQRLYGDSFSTPHNIYLCRAAESGIPSLLCYLAIVVTALIRAGKRLRENPRTALLIFLILAYLVQAFFNIATTGTSWLFYFYLGLACGRDSLA